MVAKGKTPNHAGQYRDRTSTLIALVKGTLIGDLEQGRSIKALARTAATTKRVLSQAHFGDLSPESIQSALATLSDFGKSNQTVNHYRVAIRAFLRWAHERKRVREIPMGVTSLNAEEDQRLRRILTDDGLGHRIQYAESGRVRWYMPGPLRAMAYRAAAGTGFRVDELRSLTPEAFRLDSPQTMICLKASSTKNRKPADQSIAQALARKLRDWIRDKPRGQSVFPLDHDTAKAVRADLEAIGIPYENEEGIADIHSLRAYYISEVHCLARHAKPETTLKYYAKVSKHDLRGAVETLPKLTPCDAPHESMAQASTGTDGQPIRKLFATYLPPDQDARMSPSVGCWRDGESRVSTAHERRDS